jgi:hypothetical protein
MARATQVELQLQNEVGTLARVCRDLATGGVNLLALSAPERGDERRGAIRLLVANPELAGVALARAGYSFSTHEVLFVELKNRPGALARAVEKLARAGIDIRYAYATAYTRAQKTAAVIAVSSDELERADRLLGR